MIELINEGYAETTSAYGIKLGIEGEADIWLIKIMMIFEEEADIIKMNLDNWWDK